MKKRYKEIQTAHHTTVRPTIDTGAGLTEQSHRDTCDINCILADYHKTGLLKHAAKNEGRYDDVTANDFQEAMFLVKNAQNMFEELPANIRDRFANNPASFLDFVQDESNLDEMQKMGILKGNDGIDISGAPVAVPTASPIVNQTQGAVVAEVPSATSEASTSPSGA